MKEIDIELYKVFYTVATYKNITKASQMLYISQPAVTMSIKKLEEQLGMTLFVRTKRGVLLTDEGKVLYEYVKEAMDSLKAGENKVANLRKLETGNIKIGIGTTLTKHFLIDYLEIFHKKYPKVNITIDTSVTAEVLKNLENGRVDIAIITSDRTNYNNLNIVYSEDIEDIFVANKDVKETIKMPLKLENLNDYPLIMQNINSNIGTFLDKTLLKYNIKLKGFMELTSYSLVLEFAKIGFGIGFITKKFVEEELKNKSLYEIKTTPEIPKRKILVLTKKDYLPSFSAQKLIDIITNKE